MTNTAVIEIRVLGTATTSPLQQIKHTPSTMEDPLIEEQSEDDRVCTICRDDASESALFSPCLCKSYIHQQCLVDWIKSKNNGNTNYITKCEICHADIKFKRNYDAASASVSVSSVLKKALQPALQALKYVAAVVAVVFGVLWVLICMFVVKKYHVYKTLPSWNTDYVLQDIEFINPHALTMVHFIVAFFSSYLSVLKNAPCRKILASFLETPNDHDPAPADSFTTAKKGLIFTIMVPVSVCLLLFIETLSIKTTRLLFKTYHYSDSANAVIGMFFFAAALSYIPLTKIPRTSPKVFRLLFYIKYVCKDICIRLFQYFSMQLVFQAAFDYLFSEPLTNQPMMYMPLSGISWTDFLVNTHLQLLSVVLGICEYIKQVLFRPGACFFLPTFAYNPAAVDMMALYPVHVHFVQAAYDIVRVIAIMVLLFGSAVKILCAYKSQLLPVLWDLPGLWVNSQHLVEIEFNAVLGIITCVSSPMLSNFASVYFKPLAIVVASRLRLSSYFFEKSNAHEKGHVAYRSHYHEYFHREQARLSSPTLYSKPVSENTAAVLFSSIPGVHAYFVPDGTYARVPGFSEMDVTEDYFVPVTRDDRVLHAAATKAAPMFAEFRNVSQYSYDVVYLPPRFKGRLFVFYLVMGLICNTTLLYFWISSNFIGKNIMLALRYFAKLQPRLNTESYFTFVNIFLGLSVQLVALNFVISRRVPKVRVMVLLYIVKMGATGYAAIEYLVRLGYIANSCLSFMWLMTASVFHYDPLTSVAIDTRKQEYYVVFPTYLFHQHVSTSFFVIYSAIAIMVFFMSSRTVLVENPSAKQTALLILRKIVKPSMVPAVRCFLPPMVLYVVAVFLKHYRDIRSLAHMREYMYFFCSSSPHGWSRDAVVLFGSTLCVTSVLFDIYRVLNHYWTKSKAEILDDIHENDIVLENNE